MAMPRRTFGAALLGGGMAASALAQSPTWPNRPVRLISPFAPGGPQDVRHASLSISSRHALVSPWSMTAAQVRAGPSASSSSRRRPMATRFLLPRTLSPRCPRSAVISASTRCWICCQSRWSQSRRWLLCICQWAGKPYGVFRTRPSHAGSYLIRQFGGGLSHPSCWRASHAASEHRADACALPWGATGDERAARWRHCLCCK